MKRPSKPKYVKKYPYFDEKQLPAPESAYVAWLDVMGVARAMERSIADTANFVFKLHVAVLEAPKHALRLYPVMDGVYAASRHWTDLESFLSDVLSRLCDLFLSECDNKRRFVVRAGLARGLVYHGSDITKGKNFALNENPTYKGAILLGTPVVRAHECERRAPPFGVAVDGAECGSVPVERSGTLHEHWRWFRHGWHSLAVDALAALEEYYAWCAAESERLEYPVHRIEEHRARAREYFGTPRRAI